MISWPTIRKIKSDLFEFLISSYFALCDPSNDLLGTRSIQLFLLRLLKFYGNLLKIVSTCSIARSWKYVRNPWKDRRGRIRRMSTRFFPWNLFTSIEFQQWIFVTACVTKVFVCFNQDWILRIKCIVNINHFRVVKSQINVIMTKNNI